MCGFHTKSKHNKKKTAKKVEVILKDTTSIRTRHRNGRDVEIIRLGISITKTNMSHVMQKVDNMKEQIWMMLAENWTDIMSAKKWQL